MYTEDDEKVTVKTDKSNSEYTDFYTSFNEIEKKEVQSKKNNKKDDSKKNDLKPEPKEEKDYSDFYVSDDVEEVVDNKSKNKKNHFKIILGIALFIILAIIIIIIIILTSGGKKVSGDIELVKSDITLNIGAKDYISYKVVDTNSNVTSTFESSNSNIVTVDNSGGITALDIGDAVITIHYTIDGVTRDKQCNVKVTNDGNVDTSITLNLSGAGDTWFNQDVVIQVETHSIFGIAKVQYALNCDSDCNYQDITNNQILVSNSGTTNVRVIARDNKNQEAIKETVVKIDRESPNITLNSNKNIVSNNDVTVCATCSDNMSGCKQEKVCKTYTSSNTNQVITVEDIAGNKKNSDSFNVTINKTTKVATRCTLKASADGTVTATLNGEATYYGFNSSYTGNNQLSTKITINASKAGESKAQMVNYYFKNKNGMRGSCSILVIKTCSCQGSSGSNCPVTCTFRSQ